MVLIVFCARGRKFREDKSILNSSGTMVYSFLHSLEYMSLQNSYTLSYGFADNV